MTAAVPPSQPVTALSAPDQDPTALTTQLVDRALLAFELRMKERLDGMDKATALHADNVGALRTSQENSRTAAQEDVARQLTALREILMAEIGRVGDVMREKFYGVEQQFSQRDIALAAALAAQKEAVREQNTSNDRAFGKSEQNQKEQVAGLTALTTTSVSNLNERITEIKERLDRAPGELAQQTHQTQRETQQTQQQGTGQNILVWGIVLATLVGLASLIVSLMSRGG